MSTRLAGTATKGDVSVDIEARLLELLGHLPLLRRGLVPFYQSLLNEPVEPLRVAAIIALLELRAIWSTQADLVLQHAHHGAVKKRAFAFFQSVFEYDLARTVADTPAEDDDGLLSARMHAELERDYERAAALSLDLFMATSIADYIWQAQDFAEQAGGWRLSLPVHTISLLARPMDPNGPFQLPSVLLHANRLDLLGKVCDAFDHAQVYQSESAVFRAAILADEGRHADALKLLERVPASAPNARLSAFVLQLRANSLEATGAYRDAYGAFQQMNAIGRPAELDAQSYARGVRQRAALRFSGLAEDPRTASTVMMLGFPRSGTTLLENAIGAHPLVETFEEMPAMTRLARWLERFARSQDVPPEIATAARDKYFDELERSSRKPAALIRVDKMPMTTADGVLLKHIMPSMRFIFSIRHPYDVVLSCFRQSFTPNAAMENFRTIADAAALYDFAMSQWFSVHTLDDPAVCYVRYEDLVNTFRPTVERVLSFMGVEWDDAILGFAEAADRRSAKTPSYKKVRSGLSIGVQSARQNYDFLWSSKETAVLDKWVKHFGYAD